MQASLVALAAALMGMSWNGPGRDCPTSQLSEPRSSWVRLLLPLLPFSYSWKTGCSPRMWTS